MLTYKAIAAVCLALAFSACGKEPAAGEQMDAATRVGVSTSGVVGETINAPGNYMRGMQNKVEAAKGAAAVYEKAAETHDGNKAEAEEGN